MRLALGCAICGFFVKLSLFCWDFMDIGLFEKRATRVVDGTTVGLRQPRLLRIEVPSVERWEVPALAPVKPMSTVKVDETSSIDWVAWRPVVEAKYSWLDTRDQQNRPALNQVEMQAGALLTAMVEQRNPASLPVERMLHERIFHKLLQTVPYDDGKLRRQLLCDSQRQALSRALERQGVRYVFTANGDIQVIGGELIEVRPVAASRVDWDRIQTVAANDSIAKWRVKQQQESQGILDRSGGLVRGLLTFLSGT